MAIDREWRKGLLLLLSRSFVSDSSDPMDCSLPGSSIHGIFQAKVLEWGAIAFSAISIINFPQLIWQLKLDRENSYVLA